MKVLITGSKGFIGRNLEPKIKAAGHEVISIDSRKFYGEPYIRAQIATLVGMIETADVVIHLAAYTDVGKGEKKRALYLRNNISCTIDALEMAVNFGAKRFIYMSTAEVLGYSKRPSDYLTVNAGYKPTSVYGTSKATGEMICKHYKEFFNVEVIRTQNLYGPYQQSRRLIPSMIEKALLAKVTSKWWDATIHQTKYKGYHVRQWTYVEDLCDYITTSLDMQPPEIVHFVGPVYSTDRIVKIIAEITKTKCRLHPVIREGFRPGNEPYIVIDNTRRDCYLNSDYFRQTLKETIEWEVHNNGSLRGELLSGKLGLA